MLTTAAIVILVNVTFGVASPLLARGLTPPAATRLISLVSFLTTLASGFVLCVVCFDFIAQFPLVAGARAWSTSSLNSDDAIPVTVGVLVTLAVVLAAGRACLRVARVAYDLRASFAACRALASVHTTPVIVVDDRPDAFALPGVRGGQIVVTSAMRDALDSDEMRVLLAHEASHLRHKHHLYIALADLAVAANPFVRRVRRVVRLTAERWADEDAARTIGDRHLTARAVARAALASSHSQCRARPGAALAMTHSAVRQRAQALLAPAPRTRPEILALVLVAVILTSASSLTLAHRTAHRFEQAHAAYVQS